MDSIPMVAVTCNVVTNLLGKDSFQEIDIVGVTMPITKHNFLVKKAEDIAPTFRKAFKIAASGRPGPVSYTHLDVYKRQPYNLSTYAYPILFVLIKALATLPPHRRTMPFPLAVPARLGFAFIGMCSRCV